MGVIPACAPYLFTVIFFVVAYNIIFIALFFLNLFFSGFFPWLVVSFCWLIISFWTQTSLGSHSSPGHQSCNCFRNTSLFVETSLWVISLWCHVVHVTLASCSFPLQFPPRFGCIDFMLSFERSRPFVNHTVAGSELGTSSVHCLQLCHQILISFAHISLQIWALARVVWLREEPLTRLAHGVITWQSRPPSCPAPHLHSLEPESLRGASSVSNVPHHPARTAPSPGAACALSPIWALKSKNCHFQDCHSPSQGNLYPTRALGECLSALSLPPHSGPDFMVSGWWVSWFIVWDCGHFIVHWRQSVPSLSFSLWVFCWVSKEGNGIFKNAFVVIFNRKP